jgi:HK97 family phage major capsid protein
MAKTLFELKQALQTIGQQYQMKVTELSEAAMDVSKDIEDIKALESDKLQLEKRLKVLQEQHDEMDREQKEQLKRQQQQQQSALGGASASDPKQLKIKAQAELIRATMKNQNPTPEIFAALGDRNNTGGEKILPSTLSNEVLVEPLVKNQLRGVSTFTQITNLEIPKLSFTLDDDDFIADTATAKELEVEGDTVVFGRFKFKVFAQLSETILNGSDIDLTRHVDNALASGVAAKERKVAFATTPKAGEESMSFYSTQNAITQVDGADALEAIQNALADLHEDYRDNAKIVMRFADYSAILKTLNNGTASFHNAAPEQILGKPVIFSDAAVKPIVGDFSYSHFNYDLKVLFDRDKEVKTGMELFVITAWMDHKIKLKSAFRIANVTEPVATP